VAEYIELTRRLPLSANSIEAMLAGSAARLLNLH